MPILRIAGLEEESIVDGPGLRFTVFVQGCLKNCRGCQNPETHALDGGTLIDVQEIFARFRNNPLLAGMTFSGGEPFLQPEPLLWLARKSHAMNRSVISFSGYTLEELFQRGRREPSVMALLDELDALIDGPYVEDLRDLDLQFRGSSNQRYLTRTEMDRILARCKEN